MSTPSPASDAATKTYVDGNFYKRAPSRLFDCEYCGYTSVHLGTLMEHHRRVHETSYTPYAYIIEEEPS